MPRRHLANENDHENILCPFIKPYKLTKRTFLLTEIFDTGDGSN